MLPVVPHLTHGSPYTPIIFTLTIVSLLAILPILPILPLRPTFLFLGLFPLFITHPFTLHTLLPAIQAGAQPAFNNLRTRAARFVDDDRLDDRHWGADLREVELFENERWAAPAGRSGSVMARTSSDAGDDAAKAGADAGWAKTNLRVGERRAWTRGRDGWSGVGEDGGGDVRSGFPLFWVGSWRGADWACGVAATSHSRSSPAGRSSRRRIGGRTWWAAGSLRGWRTRVSGYFDASVG